MEWCVPVCEDSRLLFIMEIVGYLGSMLYARREIDNGVLVNSFIIQLEHYSYNQQLI